VAGRDGLESLLLPQGGGDIRGQIHDPIHLPFAGVHAKGPLPEVDSRPTDTTHYTHSEATPQHQQKHCAVFQRIDHPKEGDDVGLRHRTGEPRGHEELMPGELNGRLRQGALVTQVGSVFIRREWYW
jgi:hypothetical protein